MVKLLVGSTDVELIERVRTVLEKHLNNHIDIFMDKPSLAKQLESRIYSLGIFRATGPDKATLDLMEKVRTMGFSFPMILATEKMTPEARKFLDELSDVHLLTAPYGERALVGLTRKLMMARRVPRQAHRRFNTNLMAQMESMSSGNPLLTSMYNLSKGGAYCEFDSRENITVGDLIKLKINLEDTKSDYDLSAKVVWTVQKGRFSGRFGCGFKFISTQDAYSSLISKL